MSAKDGSGIDSLIRLAEKAYSISIKDLETPILNKILQQATKMQPPPYNKKFRPKLRYAHAGGKNPPVIITLKDFLVSFLIKLIILSIKD